MAAKRKAASPSGPRLNRARIIENVRRNRSFRGDSGTDRKNLFVQIKGTLKCWVLPDLKLRGPGEEEYLPYVRLATHWVNRVKKDGTTFRGGITCLEDMAKEEPHVRARLIEAKIIGEEAPRCAPCEILRLIGEDDLPQGKYGGSVIDAQAKFHLPVVLPKSAYSRGPENLQRNDNQIVKILSLTTTGRDNFMDAICDDDLCPEGFFEENGIFTVFQQTERSYTANVSSAQECWYDWKGNIPDMEIVTPTFLTLAEQVEALVLTLPQLEGAIREIFEGAYVPVEKPEKKAGPTRKSVIKKRIKS